MVEGAKRWVVKIMAAKEPADETTEWTRQKKSTFDREAKRGREQRVCVCVCWGGGCGPWMRGWKRGGTLKECQSDF